jgi:hypothetical protein
MARFQLKARDGTEGQIIGGIPWGTHKFLVRTFLDLGSAHTFMISASFIPCFLITIPFRYQLRFALVTAGDYGSPQPRSRVIYMASRCEARSDGAPLRLPPMPSPTHVLRTPPPTAIISSVEHRSCGNFPTAPRTDGAAHPGATVSAAISDLPRWDWWVFLIRSTECKRMTGADHFEIQANRPP